MSKSKQIIRTGVFVAVLIICGTVKIPVFAVPFSLIFIAVNFIALVSDCETGLLSILIYILTGLLGVPVFSQGGGIGYVLNPTFGYIIGFLILQPVCALGKNIISDEFFTPWIKNIILGIINLIVVYTIGCCYGYLISTLYLKQELSVGYFISFYILVFMPGDIISVVLSAYLAKKLKFAI